MGLTLDRVKPGNYRVIDLVGGYGFTRKLTDMGIYPGVVLTVVSPASMGGPVRVMVKGTQYAIGKGMASKIYVTRV